MGVGFGGVRAGTALSSSAENWFLGLELWHGAFGRLGVQRSMALHRAKVDCLLLNVTSATREVVKLKWLLVHIVLQWRVIAVNFLRLYLPILLTSHALNRAKTRVFVKSLIVRRLESLLTLLKLLHIHMT